MFYHMLESSQWDDSNTWSNIGFSEEIGIIEIKIHTLSRALISLVDAVREVRKYSGPAGEVDLKHTPEAENLAHMRLFRAQRNLYIAGFALFLWL